MSLEALIRDCDARHVERVATYTHRALALRDPFFLALAAARLAQIHDEDTRYRGSQIMLALSTVIFEGGAL